jgi:hypothetical protein
MLNNLAVKCSVIKSATQTGDIITSQHKQYFYAAQFALSISKVYNRNSPSARYTKCTNNNRYNVVYNRLELSTVLDNGVDGGNKNRLARVTEVIIKTRSVCTECYCFVLNSLALDYPSADYPCAI